MGVLYRADFISQSTLKDTNMTDIVKDNIPELNIELMDDSTGSLILLEQDSGGNLDRIAIHPIHIRYMAEKFGIIPTSGYSGRP